MLKCATIYLYTSRRHTSTYVELCEHIEVHALHVALDRLAQVHGHVLRPLPQVFGAL